MRFTEEGVGPASLETRTPASDPAAGEGAHRKHGKGRRRSFLRQKKDLCQKTDVQTPRTWSPASTGKNSLSLLPKLPRRQHPCSMPPPCLPRLRFLSFLAACDPEQHSEGTAKVRGVQFPPASTFGLFLKCRQPSLDGDERTLQLTDALVSKVLSDANRCTC